MSNPIPESADRGDLIAVTVTGRLRASLDGAVTVDVPDMQEPVLRLPWAAIDTFPVVTPAADSQTVNAYQSSVERDWRGRAVGFPAEMVFTTETPRLPDFDVEAAPGSDVITVGRYDLTPEQATRLAAILADAAAVARSADDKAATAALRARGAAVTP